MVLFFFDSRTKWLNKKIAAFALLCCCGEHIMVLALHTCVRPRTAISESFTGRRPLLYAPRPQKNKTPVNKRGLSGAMMPTVSFVWTLDTTDPPRAPNWIDCCSFRDSFRFPFSSWIEIYHSPVKNRSPFLLFSRSPRGPRRGLQIHPDMGGKISNGH